ncbi:importin-5-like protein, partial [Tanacetum coccineum]
MNAVTLNLPTESLVKDILVRCVDKEDDRIEAAMLILGSMRLYNMRGPISLEMYITSLKNAYSADVRIATFDAAITYTGIGMSGNYVRTTSPLTTLNMDIPRRMLVGFVRSAFEIAESQSLEKEMRHLAIYFMITLFGILMLMFSYIKNEVAPRCMENQNDGVWKSRDYSVPLEFLHRLAVHLYDKTIVWRVLDQYLGASDNQKCVAAIFAFAQVSEVYLK